jgi:hypothetical protein
MDAGPLPRGPDCIFPERVAASSDAYSKSDESQRPAR